MRLPALFASVALAFTALPAALACDPLIAGNMTTLEHDLFAWNTTMEAYLQGDVTQTEEALKVSTQLSLSINMTAMSLVESTMTLHHKDSKKLIALYDTLEADVTSITAKLTEKTEVLMDVQVIGFLDEALPSVEYASDFLADTLAGKSSASFTEHIKQVAASVDSSIEGVLESVHAHDASPAPPKDDAQETNITASAQGDGKSSVKASTDGGEVKAVAKAKGDSAANVETDGDEGSAHASSNGDSSVAMSGSGDVQMSGSSKSSSHASASIDHSNKERRAEVEDVALVRRSPPFSPPFGPPKRDPNVPVVIQHAPKGHHNSGSGGDADTQNRRSEPEDVALVRRAESLEKPVYPHLPGTIGGHDAAEKDRRSAADDVIYARHVNAEDTGPELSQDPPGYDGKMESRSEAEDFLYARRPNPRATRASQKAPLFPRPPSQNKPGKDDHKAHGAAKKEKRSEAKGFVYVRRDDTNESANQGDKKPPKFPSTSKHPGPGSSSTKD